MTHISRAALALLALLVMMPAQAQSPGNVKVAAVSAKTTPAAITRGGHGVLAVTLAVAPGFHVNAHKPNDPDLIPTDWAGAKTPGVTWGAPRFPAPRSVRVSYEKLPMLVYQGRTTVLIPYTVTKTAKPGRLALGGTLTYQGCNATSCYPPTSAAVKASVTVK